MTPGHILKLAGKVGEILEKDGATDAAGNFITPVSIIALVKVTEDAVKLLEAEGVKFDANIEQVVAALPALLALLGVK